MNSFNHLLSAGDLRSDGFADEVVQIVSGQLDLLPDLMEALTFSNPVIRGHAADALEKVSRNHPKEVVNFLSMIVKSALMDNVGMVRWHLAMVLGNLAISPEIISIVKKPLFTLLKDENPFVRSWSITSLCIIARNSPMDEAAIVQKIAVLASDPSAAVAKRAQTALHVLSEPDSPLPRTWVKSRYVRKE